PPVGAQRRDVREALRVEDVRVARRDLGERASRHVALLLEVGPERLLEVAERAQPRLDAPPLLALFPDPPLLPPPAGPGRGDPVARRAELLPPARVLDAVVEVLGRPAPALREVEARVGEVDRALDADRLRVAARLARALVQRREVGAELLLVEPRVVGEP